MNRLLILSALTVVTAAACSDPPIAYQCTTDSDCSAGNICWERWCVVAGDAGGADGAASDAGENDANLDAGALDGAVAQVDSGVVDAAVDASLADGGVSDGGASDGGVADSGASDAGAADGGVVDAGPPTCAIGQTTFQSGDLNPGNHCVSCQPAYSTSSWTNVANGSGCGSGLICIGGTCAANCWIDSAEYASLATKNGNTCLVCDPNTSTSTWTNAAEGTTCNDADYCHAGTCLEGCWIDSGFHQSGSARPGYSCQECQPGTSKTNWTALPDGTERDTPTQNCRCQAGLTWCGIASGTTSALFSISGSASNSLWAVGESGSAIRWNGSTWSSYPSGVAQDLYGVWEADSKAALAVGASGTVVQWQGVKWTTVSSGVSVNLNAIWGSGKTDVWAVGAKGTILHWNGSAWLAVPSGTSYELTGVSGSGPYDAWAVGYSGTVLHWNGSGWSLSPKQTCSQVASVWSSNPNDAWTGCSTRDEPFGSYHWNGSSWTGHQVEPLVSELGTTHDFLVSSTFGTATDAWATGAWLNYYSPRLENAGVLFHWNGTDWSTLDMQTVSLNSIWGLEDDYWVVGAKGTVFHATR